MESSRRDLFNGMAEQGPILKNNLTTTLATTSALVSHPQFVVTDSCLDDFDSFPCRALFLCNRSKPSLLPNWNRNLIAWKLLNFQWTKHHSIWQESPRELRSCNPATNKIESHFCFLFHHILKSPAFKHAFDKKDCCFVCCIEILFILNADFSSCYEKVWGQEVNTQAAQVGIGVSIPTDIFFIVTKRVLMGCWSR